MKQENTTGIRLIRIAAIYMLIGLGIGLFMGIGKDDTLVTVHSHVALLGWMTMGLAGLVYRAWPELANRSLAVWHVWLHNLGLPVMLVSLALKQYGHPGAEPLLGLGSVAVLLGLLLFTINLYRGPKVTI